MDQIKVSPEDAISLHNTIIEVDALSQLYREGAEKGYPAEVMAVILRQYMDMLTTHKVLWRDLLVQYVGDEDASKYYRIWRYDPMKQVIFKMKIEGCKL